MLSDGVPEMYRKRVLNFKPRIAFDPSNRKHRLDYAQFLRYNNWKNGCQFFLEEPYMDIPSMINDKLVHYYLQPLMEKV